jgi:penicillin amidase
MRDVQADVVSTAARKLLPVLLATRSDHRLAAAALAQLKGFDGVMGPDQAAPLIVAVWADELTRGVIGDRLGQERFKAMYGKRHFRQGLETILADPQAAAAWCAPRTCAEQSTLALGRALDRIAAQQGNDPAAWRWGTAHAAQSTHRPFGNVAALANFFDVRVPVGGDNWTVDVGQYWTSEASAPYATRHAPSMRAIYDLADPEQSTFIYQAGQSGLVFSPRYRDMRSSWAAVQARPLRLKPDRWVHELKMLP